MQDPVQELKVRAERLHRRAQKAEPEAVAQLRCIPTLKALPAEELAQQVRRKHCLAAVAEGFGFRDWAHASRVLGADPEERDFGTLWYRGRVVGTFNQWFSDLEEARRILAEAGGYLLPYKRQFVLVHAAFVQGLGLDPMDPDWTLLGRDMTSDAEPDARRRMYGKLVSAL